VLVALPEPVMQYYRSTGRGSKTEGGCERVGKSTRVAWLVEVVPVDRVRRPGDLARADPEQRQEYPSVDRAQVATNRAALGCLAP
jgi:hypothetical protein